MLYTKFDCSLTFPNILMMMSNESPANDPQAGAHQPIQQTKMDGIVSPLIAINGNALHRSQIKKMTLTQGRLPELTLTFEDTLGIIQTLDNPDMDYIIQLQIIPPVDNMYKKINLMFRSQYIKMKNSIVNIQGLYITGGDNNIHDSKMKAYGEITSYELFESIAKEYQLGFVSNVNSTSDSRWIYNPNTTFTEFLSKEIRYCGVEKNTADNPDKHVFEWWVDFYNNLVFVDMYSEYSEIVTDEEYMTIWTTDYLGKVSSDEERPVAMKNMAMLQNYPSLIRDETYLRDPYNVFTEPPTTTDINYETFNMLDKQRRSTIISDGDVQKNYSSRYFYGGELFGDYDYLTKAACRSVFMSKITGQGLEVIVRRPMFAFWQGRKINFYWFDVNTPFSSDDASDGKETLTSNIPLPTNMNVNNVDAKFRLNKTVSGQYMVIGSKISYNVGQWTHTMRLSRYADQIQKH